MAAPIGPYTPLVQAGDFLIMSGQLGLDPNGTLVDGVVAQTEQIFDNAERLLVEHRSSLNAVAKTTVFLTNMDDYDEINEIYCSRFGTHRPARSAIAVAALPIGAAVEIEMWANRS